MKRPTSRKHQSQSQQAAAGSANARKSASQTVRVNVAGTSSMGPAGKAANGASASSGSTYHQMGATMGGHHRQYPPSHHPDTRSDYYSQYPHQQQYNQSQHPSAAEYSNDQADGQSEAPQDHDNDYNMNESLYGDDDHSTSNGHDDSFEYDSDHELGQHLLTPIPHGSREFDAAMGVDDGDLPPNMFEITPVSHRGQDSDDSAQHFVFPSPPRNGNRRDLYSPTLELSAGASILDASLDGIAYSPNKIPNTPLGIGGRYSNLSQCNPEFHATPTPKTSDFPQLASPLLSPLDLPRRRRGDESQTLYDAFANDLKSSSLSGHETISTERAQNSDGKNRHHQDAITVSFSIDTM